MPANKFKISWNFGVSGNDKQVSFKYTVYKDGMELLPIQGQDGILVRTAKCHNNLPCKAMHQTPTSTFGQCLANEKPAKYIL